MPGKRKLSKGALLVLALATYLLHGLLEKSTHLNPWYQDKIEAASLMKTALHLIREETLARGIETDAQFDPNRTGLIGPEESPITTDRGILDAKFMTLNPNFAAAVVDMLKHAGVGPGDVIAIAYTGSMPGANIAVLSACEALRLRPLIITSVGSSSWGATDPRWTWLDMEQFLVRKGIFRRGSMAASLGGQGDIAQNLGPEGQKALRQAIQRNQIPLIEEHAIEESVRRRMEIYNAHAGPKPIQAFVNIGGGIASLGSTANGALLRPGLNRSLDPSHFYPRGLMVRMAERGIPIVHFLKIREIVRDYDLARFPAPLPAVGEGKVFYQERYNQKVTLVLMLILLIGLALVVESDLYVVPELMKRVRLKRRV